MRVFFTVFFVGMGIASLLTCCAGSALDLFGGPYAKYILAGFCVAGIVLIIISDIIKPNKIKKP